MGDGFNWELIVVIATGWILETNDAMNRAMESLGGDIVKRYCIYERRFAGSHDAYQPA